MRGDRPGSSTGPAGKRQFTPHARGSTSFPYPRFRVWKVYPACAGIDHSSLFSLRSFASLPRMRGDRPFHWTFSLWPPSFTPHARGSTVGIVP